MTSYRINGTKDDVQNAIYEAGYSVRELAQELGTTYQTLFEAINRWSQEGTSRQRMPRGKVTRRAVRTINQLLEEQRGRVA